ncbi:hypothetical protein ACP275_04G189900 [Erythranthe tilingii]
MSIIGGNNGSFNGPIFHEFKKQASFFLKEKIKTTRLVLTDVTPAQLLTEEATNGNPDEPDADDLNTISRAAFEVDDYYRIVEILHKRLVRFVLGNWRASYKALIVLEHLLTHGPKRVADEFQCDVDVITEMESFQYIDDKGYNWGLNVRNKSGRVLDLLEKGPRLKQEKDKASKIIRAIQGFGSFCLETPSDKEILQECDSEFKKQASFFLKEKIKTARLALTDVTPAQLLTKEATNGNPGVPNAYNLNTISRAAFIADDYCRIVEILHKRLARFVLGNWRASYKALIVLEHLLTHGPERVADEFQRDIDVIAEMESFQHIDDKGYNWGLNMRNKSERVLDLLEKGPFLEQERDKARKITSKIQGFGSFCLKTSSEPEILQECNSEFKKEASFFLEEKIKTARLALTDVTPAQLLTEEATNGNPGEPDAHKLNTISMAAFEVDGYYRIVEIIHKRLVRFVLENWRASYKALIVLEHLLTHGPESVADEFERDIDVIKEMERFQHIDDKGYNWGLSVRKKSERVLNLLEKGPILKQERDKARKITRGIQGSDNFCLETSSSKQEILQECNSNFKKQASFFIKEKIKTARLALTDVTPAQLLAEEATNGSPGGPDAHNLKTITSAAFEVDDYYRIVDILHKRLVSFTLGNWRASYKALMVLEHLLTHGPERVAEEFQCDIDVITKMESFQHIDDKGYNWGLNVKKKSRTVLDILEKETLLKQERDEARKITREIQGFGNLCFETSSEQEILQECNLEFKKQSSSFLKEKIKSARLALTDVTRAQLLTEEATNGKPGGPDAHNLKTISKAAFEGDDYYRIVDILHKRLVSFVLGNWRASYKALIVLEHLLTHGPERVADEFQCDLDVITEMKSFQHTDDKGYNWGLNVRKKSERVLNLLEKGPLLKQEREIQGFGSSGVKSSSEQEIPQECNPELTHHKNQNETTVIETKTEKPVIIPTNPKMEKKLSIKSSSTSLEYSKQNVVPDELNEGICDSKPLLAGQKNEPVIKTPMALNRKCDPIVYEVICWW